MNSRSDVYERITSAIIEAIEAGGEKFEIPWHTVSSTPCNAISGRRYRGVNTLALWAATQRFRFTTNLWATYQQWSTKEAQVRKNSKSTVVIFWKTVGGETDEDEAARDERTGRWFACAYHVFNADQVDGFTPPGIPLLSEAERMGRAERFFCNTGACIEERGTRAYYDSAADKICMPPFPLFKKADYFYSTLAHELTHWTGAESRLNRNLQNQFGSEAYAAEELIAELGSAFLSSNLALALQPRSDHAPYIDHWLQLLKSDRKAIFTAASQAQRAVDWLIQPPAPNPPSSIVQDYSLSSPIRLVCG